MEDLMEKSGVNDEAIESVGPTQVRVSGYKNDWLESVDQFIMMTCYQCMCQALILHYFQNILF